MYKNKNDINILICLIATIKESIKFAIIAVFIFSVVGTSLFYLMLEYTKIDHGIAALIVGIVTAIVIVIVDKKKIHAYDKILVYNRKIAMKIFK